MDCQDQPSNKVRNSDTNGGNLSNPILALLMPLSCLTLMPGIFFSPPGYYDVFGDRSVPHGRKIVSVATDYCAMTHPSISISATWPKRPCEPCTGTNEHPFLKIAHQGNWREKSPGPWTNIHTSQIEWHLQVSWIWCPCV